MLAQSPAQVPVKYVSVQCRGGGGGRYRGIIMKIQRGLEDHARPLRVKNSSGVALNCILWPIFNHAVCIVNRQYENEWC